MDLGTGGYTRLRLGIDGLIFLRLVALAATRTVSVAQWERDLSWLVLQHHAHARRTGTQRRCWTHLPLSWNPARTCIHPLKGEWEHAGTQRCTGTPPPRSQPR